MKIKFNSDSESPHNKTIEIPTMIIVVRAIFLEHDKYHPHVFLDECVYYRLERNKNIICETPLRIRYNKIDGFIKIHNKLDI